MTALSGSAPAAPDPPLVLASGSPRRAAVLRQLELAFEVRVPDVAEEVEPGERPGETAERLARLKAEAVAAADPGRAMVLAADTVVEMEDRLLLKPETPRKAREMLSRLSGGEHRVHTGMALVHRGRTESVCATTHVRFRSLAAGEIARYVESGEPMDKAGAYGIQGRGAVFVEAIEGDYFNVMGFPVQVFQELLRRHGWRYAFGRIERLAEPGEG